MTCKAPYSVAFAAITTGTVSHYQWYVPTPKATRSFTFPYTTAYDGKFTVVLNVTFSNGNVIQKTAQLTIPCTP